MVKSITFTGEKGFIGERYTDADKPEKPDKYEDDWQYIERGFHGERKFDKEKYEKALERYKSDMARFKENKGKYKVPCSENLVGRTFEFSPDKINLIFGPNASGKSTIIKNIASHAFCTDGFSSFVEPLEFHVKLSNDTVNDYRKALKDVIFRKGGTSTNIDWDGSPIYFHNFENRRNYWHLGDMVGSVIENIGEEIMYLRDKAQISSAQNSFYLMHKLVKIMSRPMTYNGLLEIWREQYGNRPSDHPWRMAFDAQEEYYKSFPMSCDPKGQNTYLFDEIDKSMDILNVYELYTRLLPNLLKKYKHQIIIISHSPIVLKDEVFCSDKYNIISMNEEYTEKCRELMK